MSINLGVVLPVLVLGRTRHAVLQPPAAAGDAAAATAASGRRGVQDMAAAAAAAVRRAWAAADAALTEICVGGDYGGMQVVRVGGWALFPWWQQCSRLVDGDFSEVLSSFALLICLCPAAHPSTCAGTHHLAAVRQLVVDLPRCRTADCARRAKAACILTCSQSRSVVTSMPACANGLAGVFCELPPPATACCGGTAPARLRCGAAGRLIRCVSRHQPHHSEILSAHLNAGRHCAAHSPLSLLLHCCCSREIIGTPFHT